MLDAVQNQLVLLRTDLNLPLKDGKIADNTRLINALPTIEKLLKQGCGIAICSHLGRPNGEVKAKYSLKPVATALAKSLGRAVEFLPDCTADKSLELGEVILLENTRFYPEEKNNNTDFAAKLAKGCDVFVMDAFGTAHRSHASTVGVAKILPSQMGILLHKELTILQGILHEPPRPLVVLVGGAKLTTKIGVLKNIVKFADTILLGGGIANTFLKHTGKMDVEGSLYEEDAKDLVNEIMQLAEQNNCSADSGAVYVYTRDLSGAWDASPTYIKAHPDPTNLFNLSPSASLSADGHTLYVRRGNTVYLY